MSRRLLILPVLVGLLLAGSLETAAAKPPDLPADLTDTCAPQPWEGISEDMLIGAGMYAAFGVPAVAALDLYGLTAQPDDPACDPLTRVSTCVDKVLGRCYQAVACRLVEATGEEAEPTEPPTAETAPVCPPVLPASPGGSTCPYMKQQAAAKQQSAAAASAEVGSVLENLNKLVKAEKVYRKAERCRQHGQIEQAGRLYQEVKGLCPGSRFDLLASAQLLRMQAQQSPPAAPVGSEEQEATPAPAEDAVPEDAAGASPKTDAHARVSKLLKRCERAFQAGDYDEAERLALHAALRMQQLRKQMYTLEPVVPKYGTLEDQEPAAPVEEEPSECPPEEEDNSEPPQQPENKQSIPFEETQELLGMIQDLVPNAPVIGPACGIAEIYLNMVAAATRTTAEQSGEPQADEPEGGAALEPSLPPVDPRIVDALEKALSEIGEPTAGRLIIQVDEEPAGSEEQEEEPVSQWPYLPSDVEIPSLLVAPVDSDLELAEDDAEAAEEPNDPEAPAADVNELLRNVLEAVQQGACVEVDGSQPSGLRIRCEIQVSGVECRMYGDSAGHGYVVCTLLPEACRDLRAAQRAHNQHIIDWITTMNSYDPDRPDTDAGAEEEAEGLDEDLEDALTP